MIQQTSKATKHRCKQPYSHSFSDDCKDLVPEIWKAHYESNYGNICDNYVGPWNKCDTAWYYCDSKKCGEFCKKTCNKC